MGWVDEVAADAPLSWYRMNADSGSSETDLGSLGNTGTYVNSPFLASAGAISGDYAVRFSAVGSQRMTAPDQAGYSISTTGGLTVEFFASIASVPGATQYIVTKGTTSFFEWAAQVTSAGVWQMFVWKLDGTFVASVNYGTLGVGRFHHCVATFRDTAGTTTMNTYVNGAFANTNTFSTSLIGDGTALLNVASRGDATGFLNGTVDEVAVYNTDLSAARVAAHYQASLRPGVQSDTKQFVYLRKNR